MIDLHIHTTYSDGMNTVEEILEKCEQRKLEYISITDHNSCGAYYDKAFNNNNIFTGTIIKGCELNAEFQNRAIEILGYNVNTDIIMEWKEKYYSIEKTKEHTEKVRESLLNTLNKKGIIYNEKDIRPQKNIIEYIERPIWEEIVKHPENKVILGEEFFNSFGAFERKGINNPESEYFGDRISTYRNAKEVIDLIHKAGGKAFLAHPFKYRFDDTIKFIDDLTQTTELDGIECYHPSSEDENKKDILLEYAKRNNLLVSGGSDYHGRPKQNIEVGVGKGNLCISKDILNWL